MIKIASWFLLFRHIFSRILYAFSTQPVLAGMLNIILTTEKTLPQLNSLLCKKFTASNSYNKKPRKTLITKIFKWQIHCHFFL